MKKYFRRITALLFVCSMSCGTACVIKQKNSNDSKAYVGLGYWVAKNGASAETGAAIGVLSVWQSGVWGYAVTCAFGGPAGLAAGAAIGL